MDLKNISLNKVIKEWNILKQMSFSELERINGRSRLGCDIIDYFFFEHRLKTKGNKGINFYEFVDQIEYYKTKPYIQTLLEYCEKNNRYNDSLVKRYYYIYGLTFGRINSFKITNALKIYHTYKPTKILDPFCGFGGRMAAALMLDIPYIGIDINHDLQCDYERMLKTFDKSDNKFVELYFKNCLSIDYTLFKYDMVFTSPPYENIEIYPNNPTLNNKEWNVFYNTIFRKIWDAMPSGIFAINIHEKIYKGVLVTLFGECSTKILLSKSNRNDYKEWIYVWIKSDLN